MKKKTNNRVGVGPLKVSTGQLITDDDKMAELLNFFCSVFTREDCSSLPDAEQIFTGDTDHIHNWSDFLHARRYGFFHFGENHHKSGIGSCIAPNAGFARHPVKGKYICNSLNDIRI